MVIPRLIIRRKLFATPYYTLDNDEKPELQNNSIQLI